MSKPKKSASTRELPEEGTHAARCKAIADGGTQTPNNPEWDDRPVIFYLFELVDLSVKGNPVYQVMTLTNTAKSKGLKKLLESWMGVDDVANYDQADAINQPALLKIKHSKDGQYANIISVMEPPKGTKVGKGVMTPVVCFLDDSFDQDAFEALPEWMQLKMMDSPEYEEVSAPVKGKGKARRSRDVEEEEEEDEKPRKKVVGKRGR